MAKNKLFKSFTLSEMISLSLIAALGIAAKPVVASVTHVLSGPLNMPGGALSGGLYMMFPILGGAFVRKNGAVTFVCLIQAIAVSVSGIYGGHGILSLLTYLAPGVAVDLLWALIKNRGDNLLSCFLGGMLANLSGTVMVNLIFFNLPLAPFLMISAIALFSGGLGGLAAWNIAKYMRKLKALP